MRLWGSGNLPVWPSLITRWLNTERQEPVHWRDHLDNAANWLARAQDRGDDGGVSAFYNIRKKTWAGAYPETTGYIIPTFYHYSDVAGRPEFAERATEMARWECRVQMASGAVRAGTLDSNRAVPTIFNTGQVLFGWSAAYRRTGEVAFAEALRRASDWLIDAQDGDGAWRRFGSPFVAQPVNVYNTRTAFALVHSGITLDEPRYIEAARANVSWALTQMQANGWLANNDLEDNRRPLTHTLGYALHGILSVGIALNEEPFIEAATVAARAVADNQRGDGGLPGRLDSRWRPAARWSCLTGDAQMALVWLLLERVTGLSDWRERAEQSVRFVAGTQQLTTADHNRRGAIAGSFPVRGHYMGYRYPNWAAKFFMDALIMLEFGVEVECAR